MKKLGKTAKGYILFVEISDVNCRRYLSDEIAGGVVVWDTAITSLEMVKMAIKEEEKALKLEKNKNY